MKGPSPRIDVALATVIVLSFCSALVSQSEQETLRLIHADILKQETIDGKVQQTLRGNVEFKQGETTIVCDLASQYLGEDPVSLVGNVQIWDEDRKLHADTVDFYQSLGKQVARGHVVSITEADTTYSDHLIYFDGENKIVSKGDVRIVRTAERSEVRTGHLEYWRDTGYGKLWSNPRWLKYDSLGVLSMTTSGDTMEIFNQEDRMLVKENVKIEQETTEARCAWLVYFQDEERAILTGHPTVVQSNQNISGDTLQLHFQDSELQRAVVYGNAQATSDADTTQSGRWVNKLTGKKMTFFFTGEELERVVIQEQATSQYHIIDGDQYKGLNEVSGDEIEVLLADGQARQVKVVSSPDVSSGKYVPPKRL